MAKIPKFKTLEAAAAFWESHDFEDYVDDTEPVELSQNFPWKEDPDGSAGCQDVPAN